MERDVEENIFDCFNIANSQNFIHNCGGFEKSAAVSDGIVDGFAKTRFQKWRFVAPVG